MKVLAIILICIVLLGLISQVSDDDDETIKHEKYDIRYDVSTKKYHLVAVYSDGSEKQIRTKFYRLITFDKKSEALLELTKLNCE